MPRIKYGTLKETTETIPELKETPLKPIDAHKPIPFPAAKIDPPHKHSERLAIYSHLPAEEGCVAAIDKCVGWINTEERILIIDGSQYQFGTLKDFDKEPEEVSVDVLISALRSKNISINKDQLIPVLRILKALEKNAEITFKELLNLKL